MIKNLLNPQQTLDKSATLFTRNLNLKIIEKKTKKSM